MQLLNNTTHRYQSKLAGYCRNGIYQPIPGVSINRVKHYRRLVFNVIDDMLLSAYPLTHDLLTKREWASLVQEFFAHHPCQSPQVWSMPKELYLYITRQQSHSLAIKYPFLAELLWLEWLELELFMMEDKPATFSTKSKPRKDLLILNPEHTLQHFQYPVHLKPAKKIAKTDKGDYYLVLFREPDTGNVQFTDLSPALVLILQLLAGKPQSTKALTQQVCAHLQIPVDPNVPATIQTFINRCLENKLILGFQSASIAH